MADNLNPDNEELLNQTQFADLTGCTQSAIKKMMDSGKLTKGISYLREGLDVMIDPEKARAELRLTVKRSSCRNPQLLAWLGMEKDDWYNNETGIGPPRGMVDDMTIGEVNEEMARSELRLSLMEEEIKAGKYVEKKKVNMNLEAMGIEVRNAFLGIGPKIVPSVRAATTDRDAENILNKQLEDVLEKLSEILNRDIVV